MSLPIQQWKCVKKSIYEFSSECKRAQEETTPHSLFRTQPLPFEKYDEPHRPESVRKLPPFKANSETISN